MDRRSTSTPTLTTPERAVLVLFLFYYFAGAAINWGFVGPWIMHLASGLIIAAGIARAIIIGLPRVALWTAATGLLLVIYGSFLLDTQAVLFAGSWWAVCASCLALFYKQHVRTDVILRIALVAHVLFLVWISLGLGAADPGVPFNRLTLVPLAENQFIINIGPPGSTKHFTATLAGMLLLWSVRRCLTTRFRPRDLAICAWAAYLTLFSASRAVLLGVGFGIATMLANWYRPRRTTSLALLILGLLSVYALPSLLSARGFELPGKLGVALKLAADNPDLTAGRAWLWEYHLGIFSQNPLGGGRAALRDLDQDAELGLAPAASESFFTGLLAVYGLGAIPFFLAYLAGFMRAVRNEDSEITSLMSFVIVTTAGSSLFGNVYTPFSPVVLALVAARWSRCINEGRKPLPPEFRYA